MPSSRKGRRPFWGFALILAMAVGWPASGVGRAQESPETPFLRAEEVYPRKTGPEDARQAIALYREALSTDPEHLGALLGLAEAYWWLAEQVPKPERRALVEEGLVYARLAAEVAPDEAEAHYWYGVMQGRVGEERGILQSLFMVDDVLAAMERTLELDPDHGGAHLVLSHLYRKVPGWPLSIGNKEKALEHARISVALSPDDTSRQLNLAECLLALGRRDEASEVLRTVIAMPLTPGDEVNSRRDKERAQELLDSLGG